MKIYVGVSFYACTFAKEEKLILQLSYRIASKFMGSLKTFDQKFDQRTAFVM